MNKTWSYWLLIISLIVIVGWLVLKEVKAQGADWLPIKHVRIEGAFQYISRDKLKQVLLKQVSDGLYNADIQKIRQSVYSLPWVASVIVKRVWPDALDIKITEQMPVVRWKESGLLNSEGELFKPENRGKFTYLPLLSGPDGNKKKWLEVMRGLVVTLSHQKMALAEFKVSERRAWTIKLQNEMVFVLGKNEPLKKLERFLNTMNLIGEQQIAQVAVVDLRYPNGYSLAWKQETEQIDWKKIVEMKKNIKRI